MSVRRQRFRKWFVKRVLNKNFKCAALFNKRHDASCFGYALYCTVFTVAALTQVNCLHETPVEELKKLWYDRGSYGVVCDVLV
jgi:hypothetical protein